MSDMTYSELNDKLHQIEDSLVKISYSADQLKGLLPEYGITDITPLEDLAKIAWHLHNIVIKKFEESAHNILNVEESLQEPETDGPKEL